MNEPQQLFGLRPLFGIPRPVKRYAFEDGQLVRFRAHTLGPRNDVAIAEISAQLGRDNLEAIAQSMGHVKIEGMLDNQDTVPSIYLVPNGLSPEDELKADNEIGGIAHCHVVIPCTDASPQEPR